MSRLWLEEAGICFLQVGSFVSALVSESGASDALRRILIPQQTKAHQEVKPV